MNDIIFLCDHNLMDYSLLVIVETNPAWTEREKKRAEKNKNKKKEEGMPEMQLADDFMVRQQTKKTDPNKPSKLVTEFEKQNLGNRHKYISNNGRFLYHIAIIDYLQAFDTEKKAENWIKVWVYNRKEYKISAVNPQLYRNRFFKFMRDQVIVDQLKRKSYADRKSGLGSFIQQSTSML